MQFGKLRMANRKASHNVEARLGYKKVLDVYGNKKNGFKIPRDYNHDHLAAG